MKGSFESSLTKVTATMIMLEQCVLVNAASKDHRISTLAGRDDDDI